MSPALTLALAVLVFAAGGATGIKWQLGVQARADMAVTEVRAADARAQIRAIDKSSGQHAATLASINNQLGAAREKIVLLSGRECLDAGTVSMLNHIGGESMPAAASESASAPTAPASGGDVRFATERDAASAIATCRARYAEVASQVNQILDIEAARHPLIAAP